MNFSLETHRTRDGYCAVLRTAKDQEIGRGDCSILDAHAHYHEAGGPTVGFSFAAIAREVGRVASRVAKIRALQSALRLAGHLPPPIGTVAWGAQKALEVINAVNRGSAKAAAVWKANAALARAKPNSAAAVSMRLAVQAIGRPVAQIAIPALETPATEHEADAGAT